MMDITLKRACLIKGEHYAVGDVAKGVADKDAAFLIARGHAEKALPAKSKAKKSS